MASPYTSLALYNHISCTLYVFMEIRFHKGPTWSKSEFCWIISMRISSNRAIEWSDRSHVMWKNGRTGYQLSQIYPKISEMVGQAITSVLQVIICPTKGQLISECPFGPKTSSKIPTKLLPDCSFLEAFGASCRLPCLWYYLLIPPGKCFTCFTKTFANLTTYTGYLTLKCPKVNGSEG